MLVTHYNITMKTQRFLYKCDRVAAVISMYPRHTCHVDMLNYYVQRASKNAHYLNYMNNWNNREGGGESGRWGREQTEK